MQGWDRPLKTAVKLSGLGHYLININLGCLYMWNELVDHLYCITLLLKCKTYILKTTLPNILFVYGPVSMHCIYLTHWIKSCLNIRCQGQTKGWAGLLLCSRSLENIEYFNIWLVYVEMQTKADGH